MLKLKVGDKVRVKTSLYENRKNNNWPFGFLHSMKKYEGEIVIITEIRQFSGITEIKINLDRGAYVWLPEWFESACKLNRGRK